MGLDQLEFDIRVILASGKSHYTKDAAVNKDKSSVECTLNDDSVSTPRKNPSTSTNIILFVEKTKATCIICSKDSKGLRPLKFCHARLLIIANKSMVVNERI